MPNLTLALFLPVRSYPTRVTVDAAHALDAHVSHSQKVDAAHALDAHVSHSQKSISHEPTDVTHTIASVSSHNMVFIKPIAPQLCEKVLVLRAGPAAEKHAVLMRNAMV